MSAHRTCSRFWRNQGCENGADLLLLSVCNVLLLSMLFALPPAVAWPPTLVATFPPDLRLSACLQCFLFICSAVLTVSVLDLLSHVLGICLDKVPPEHTCLTSQHFNIAPPAACPGCSLTTTGHPAQNTTKW